MSDKDQAALDSVLALVRSMRNEHVTKFEIDLHTGAVKVEFAPEFVGGAPLEIDTSLDAKQPFDPKLCARCQKNPPDGLVEGHCRGCSLHMAGVS